MASQTVAPFARCCGELQSRLEDACSGRQVTEAWVGALDRERTYGASTGQVSGAAPFDVDVACLAKVLTATLICSSVGESKIALADEVLSYLPSATHSSTALRGVTIAQLLNHTHGLDDSSLGDAPVSPDGHIDIFNLLQQLSCAGRMSAAGSQYNYGNAGAYLAAAILEQIHRRSYTELVAERILQSIGASLRRIQDSSLTAPAVCPATGGIWLSREEILAFLQLHLGSAAGTSPFSLMCSTSVPLPGWSPIEKGAALGWKSFGSGWFGHNINAPGCTVLTRLHLQRRLALIVAVRAVKPDAAFPIMGHVFGHVLPELVTVSVPARLTGQQWSRVDRRRYVGTYESSAQRIVIDEHWGALSFVAQRNSADGQSSANGAIRLRPATQDVFFPERAGHEWLPFLQLVSPGADGRPEYLWNGRNVWKRSPL